MYRAVQFLFIYLMPLGLIADSIWSGLGVSIVGDSYSAYYGSPGSIHCYYPNGMVDKQAKMWWAQVISEFDGHLVSNRACTGSALSYQYGVSAVFWSMAQNRQLGNADVIMIMGGLNDGWVLEVTAGYGCSESQFRSGSNRLFNSLDKDYPEAQKYFILGKAHQDRDYMWGLKPKYRRWLRELIRERGYRIVDLDGYFAISADEMETARTPHPTALGMNKIAARVISEIRNGCGGYGAAYDYLETDGQGYMLTDYETNANTRIVVKYRVGGGELVEEEADFSSSASSSSRVVVSSSVDGFCEQLVIGHSTLNSQPSTLKLHSLKIYEGTTLLHSYFPVKDKYGNATLYDECEDRCLFVRGGTFNVLNYEGDYVNYSKCKAYATLADAYADAAKGETVTVVSQPSSPVSVVGRMGVKLDTRGFTGITLLSPDPQHEVKEADGVLEIVEIDIRPTFICESIEDLLTPVNGKFHIKLGNVRTNLFYSVWTAVDCRGPWKCRGCGYEQDEFVFPAPELGPTFFLKAKAEE